MCLGLSRWWVACWGRCVAEVCALELVDFSLHLDHMGFDHTEAVLQVTAVVQHMRRHVVFDFLHVRDRAVRLLRVLDGLGCKLFQAGHQCGQVVLLRGVVVVPVKGALLELLYLNGRVDVVLLDLADVVARVVVPACEPLDLTLKHPNVGYGVPA